MDFKNRLKGTVTQTLVKALLEDAGYRIIPLGIEEVIREVATLPRDAYLALGLSQTLRRMPDFFVAEQDLEKTWLVEVKYRKQWSEKTRASLGRQISEQVRRWGPLHLLVFLGTSTVSGDDQPVYRIGVIKTVYQDGSLFFLRHRWKHTAPDLFALEEEWTPTPWNELEWKDFSRVQDEFGQLTKKWKDQTIVKSMSVLQSLPDLDLFE